MRPWLVCVLVTACSSVSVTNVTEDSGVGSGTGGANPEVVAEAAGLAGTGGASATGGASTTGGMKATGGALATGGRVAATGGANAAGGTVATALCVVTDTSATYSATYVGPKPSCPQLGELYCPCIFNSVSQVTSCASGLACDACNMCEPKL